MTKTAVQNKSSFDALKSEFGYENPMQAPKIEKIVVSVAVGSIKDKKRQEFIQGRLARITGQSAAVRPSKKSIAAFKMREGDTAGYQVTLRGARMNAFLNKLIHIVLPRMKDFRGLKAGSVDEMGNYTFGIKEHTVFPETADEDAKDVFGFAVTLVTSAKTPKEAESLLRFAGLPLQAK